MPKRRKLLKQEFPNSFSAPKGGQNEACPPNQCLQNVSTLNRPTPNERRFFLLHPSQDIPVAAGLPAKETKGTPVRKRSDPPVIPAGNAGIQAPWMANRQGGLNAYSRSRASPLLRQDENETYDPYKNPLQKISRPADGLPLFQTNQPHRPSPGISVGHT